MGNSSMINGGFSSQPRLITRRYVQYLNVFVGGCLIVSWLSISTFMIARVPLFPAVLYPIFIRLAGVGDLTRVASGNIRICRA